jgi:hypothetical protein
MPADLVPNEAMPKLAASIDSPAMLRVLRHLRKAGFIMNTDSLDKRTFDVLQRLSDLGLADPGYAESSKSSPFIWASNRNGEQMLRYIETVPDQEERLQSKVTVGQRARTALTSLPESDQLAVLLAAEALQDRDPTTWPREEVLGLGPEKHVYLLRVPPDLRAFIRILDSGAIELFDIAREETLQLFLERQQATGAPR